MADIVLTQTPSAQAVQQGDTVSISCTASQSVHGGTYPPAGTCRNLVRLLNFSFITQQLASLGFLIVSVGVDLGLSLHWKSLESRLTMLEIIIVRVFTTPTINMCSHGDTEPYKNLPQSDFTETALLQLGPTAGAEEGGSDLSAILPAGL